VTRFGTGPGIGLDAHGVAIEQLCAIDPHSLACALDVDVVSAVQIAHVPPLPHGLEHAVVATDQLLWIGVQHDVVVSLTTDTHRL
jgi:hypothetical protein